MDCNTNTAALALLFLVVFAGGAPAAILEDFRFDDAMGTTIPAVANAAGSGHLFDVDADLSAVATDGAGRLDASLKANNAFGSTYVDLAPNVSSGSLYAVMELSYAFDVNTLDTAENEEIRLGFIQFDPRSTFVTGEFEIQREDDNTVSLFGNAVGSGAVDTNTATLGLTQLERMIVVLALDLDADLLDLSYSLDAGLSFTRLDQGMLDPSRGVGSLRMVLNNDLSGDGVRIDRVYVADADPFAVRLSNQAGDLPVPGSGWLLLLPALALGLRRRGVAQT